MEVDKTPTSDTKGDYILTNTELLEKTIELSGLKKGYIAEKLGITRQSLTNKIMGSYEFKQGEISDMCDLLNIDTKTKEKIFFTRM